jgi:Zn-finger nucleic acid-binding protein
MKCPIDKIDMIVVEHQKIELDFCTHCSGVWFDFRELELLVSVLKSQGYPLSEGDLLTPHQANVTEARRKCPICRRSMSKIWLGKEPKVLIDSCPVGDGLWFDGGELSQVLCQLQTQNRADARDVISFLDNAFGATCKTAGEPPPLKKL